MAEKKLVAIVQRHGDTEANKANQFRSRMDQPLNDNGLKQAHVAAKAIAGEKLEVQRIVCSPLLRAVQTADIIGDALDLPVEQDRGLISWHLGFLSGRDKDEYQDILNFYIDNPKKVIPEGESLDELEQRIYEFFKQALKEGLAVYVTHNSNIVTLDNLARGSKEGRPESSEKTVNPGGTVGVYVDEDGKYSTEVLFGEEKEAEYGS
jgi:broad specificity phosphatase PhoE